MLRAANLGKPTAAVVLLAALAIRYLLPARWQPRAVGWFSGAVARWALWRGDPEVAALFAAIGAAAREHRP